MKKALVFAMAMALGVSATAFAANPFSDVPQGHWAYESVAQLTADGAVSGYPDGSFKGDQAMTRYEMAQIVAKALAKGTINNNDALVIEFAEELDNLGVRVTKLEKESDNVKLTGSLRYRYFAQNPDDEFKGLILDKSQLRSRVGVTGTINDDWTYKALLENTKSFGHNISSSDDTTKFRRAWLQGNFGKVAVTAGRFNYIPQGSRIVIPTQGNVLDHEIDGVKVGFAAGNFDVTLAYGRQDNSNNNNNLFIGTVGTTIGTVDASLGYYSEESSYVFDNTSIITLGLGAEVLPDTMLSGMALKGSKRMERLDDFGYVLGLQYKKVDKNVAGSYNLSANYYNQPMSTYIMPSIAYTSGLSDYFKLANSTRKSELVLALNTDGFKGYRVGVDYTVAKNMVASVYYFDLKTRERDYGNKTILSQMNIFF